MPLSVIILTYNEAPNIGRTLERLAWAKEIVVIDSFSTDETLEIVGKFPRTRVIQRKFDTFADQCNFGLEQIHTDWVLSLDADYVLSSELIDEIGLLGAPASPPSTVLRRSAELHSAVSQISNLPSSEKSPSSHM